MHIRYNILSAVSFCISLFTLVLFVYQSFVQRGPRGEFIGLYVDGGIARAARGVSTICVGVDPAECDAARAHDPPVALALTGGIALGGGRVVLELGATGDRLVVNKGTAAQVTVMLDGSSVIIGDHSPTGCVHCC